jgi:UPF0755 protein
MRRILILLGLILILGFLLLGIPAMAARSFGQPAARLSPLQVVQYSAKLLWDDGLLTRPINPGAPEQTFTVQQNQPVLAIADHLQRAGLITEGSIFRDYLIYTGLDTSIQAGNYKLSPSMSIVDIAHKMQDATPSEITFVILPGWRMEEIAASLPTSGLDITPDEFLTAANASHPGLDPLSDAASTEGFLFPDSYILQRGTTVDQLLDDLLRNFTLHLSSDLREGFSRQGLSVYQAVTLASIVERETMQADEAPVIASVYLNRLKIGMKLDADPTVQYALGYNPVQQTWWTNPLSVEDFQYDSPFNTYIHDGLPPAPIDNPGLKSLQAVASPANTPYYYFSARCDGSGYHNFTQTFDEHLQDLCP